MNQKVVFWVSIGVIIYSLLCVFILPLFIKGFLWQIMLMPAVFQIPILISAKSIINQKGVKK